MLTDQTLALVGTITTVGGAAKVTSLTATALREAAAARKAADVLAKAEYVVAGVPSSFGQSGAITSGVYRIETVTNEMRAAFRGADYLDPRDNVFKRAPAGEVMAVDHIYPSQKIIERPGFDKLTKEQMTNILQDKVGLDNLQPLPSSLNQSKGKQIGWESGYKGEPIDANYLVALEKKQSIIETKIDKVGLK